MVHILFTFYILNVLKLKNNFGVKRLTLSTLRTMSDVYNVDTDSKWLFVKLMADECPDSISNSFKLFLVAIR